MVKAFLSKCLIFSGIVLSVISCIRDRIEPCPPMSVEVAVIDKNYFNIDHTDLELPVDESLPFGNYISILRYDLVDLATGDIVAQNEVTEFEDDKETFRISFCECLPHGTYVLTIFAGGGQV